VRERERERERESEREKERVRERGIEGERGEIRVLRTVVVIIKTNLHNQ
jgi:hypothetical protein